MALGPGTNSGRKLGRGLASLLGEPAPDMAAVNGDEPTAAGVVVLAPSAGLPSAMERMLSPTTSGPSLPRAGMGNLMVPPGGEAILKVPLQTVRPNPFQPREDFDDTGLAELADSMRTCGVINPLVVRRAGDGNGYELIAGERRLRAARLAGLESVPIVVRVVSDSEALEQALVENIQRRDLNPIEKARALRDYIARGGLSQTDAEGRLGLSRSEVTNHLRLLKLGGPVQEMVRRGAISYGHGRALVPVADADRQRYLAERVIAEGLSVRALEDLLRVDPSRADPPQHLGGPDGSSGVCTTPPDPPTNPGNTPPAQDRSAPVTQEVSAAQPATSDGDTVAAKPNAAKSTVVAARSAGGAARLETAVAAKSREAQLRELEDEFAQALGLRVRLKANRKMDAGTLTVAFESLEEFDSLREAILGKAS